MTVLDRLNRHRMGQGTRELTAAGSTTESLSSTPAAKPAVVLRLQAVITTLNKYVIDNDETGLSRFAFLMQSLTDEVIEELGEKDEAAIKGFMEQMGEVIAWVGHGDNERLPEQLRIFAETFNPPALVES